jgi:hypothetical protein
MSLSMSNGYLTSLLGIQVGQPGLALSYINGGSLVPANAGAPNCVGISLGASGQLCTPGDIARVLLNVNASAVADGDLLALPVGITCAYPLIPGNLVPAADVISGTPIIYALALAAKAGGGLVNALILGAGGAAAPAINTGFPPNVNSFVHLGAGVPVTFGPVPGGVVRLLLPAFLDMSGEGPTMQVQHVDASAVARTLFSDIATGPVVLPALMPGESFTFTPANADSVSLCIGYIDFPASLQPANPVVLATRSTLIPLTPLVINGPAAGFAYRNWATMTQYMDAGNGASGAFGDYGLTGLLIYNPDSVAHQLTINHVEGIENVEIVDANLNHDTSFSGYLNGIPIGSGKSVSLLAATAQATLPLSVFALWSLLPIAP